MGSRGAPITLASSGHTQPASADFRACSEIQCLRDSTPPVVSTVRLPTAVVHLHARGHTWGSNHPNDFILGARPGPRFPD
jgi:hypothetical protein